MKKKRPETVHSPRTLLVIYSILLPVEEYASSFHISSNELVGHHPKELVTERAEVFRAYPEDKSNTSSYTGVIKPELH